MKSKRIINTVCFALAFMALGYFVVFYGSWFIPSAWLELAALTISLPVSILLSFRTIPARSAAIRSLALPNTLIVKIGGAVFYTFMLWLLLAQSLPAAVTNIFGEARTKVETVSRFYRSTSTCRHKLILSNTNPPFGGYCNAGVRNAFYTGQAIVVKYKASVFGLSVLSFQPRNG